MTFSAKKHRDDFRISVGELAGVNSLWDSSLTNEIVVEGRLQLGQRLHAAYQQEALERHVGYMAEKGVSWETVRAGVRVVVSGRIDGIYQDDSGRWIVEELKSRVGSGRGMELLVVDPGVMEAFKRQCSLYMHFWAEECAKKEIDCTGEGFEITGYVVFMDAIDGSVSRVEVFYDPSLCREYVKARLDELLEIRRKERERERARSDFAEKMEFPFPGYRLYQKELADNVEGAFESGMNLGLSAPTGIGKTAAALHPSLRSCLSAGRRLFFVTAKVGQQELALDTLHVLLGGTDTVTALQIEAKERSCPQEEMLCIPGSCNRLSDSGMKMAAGGLPERLLRGGVVKADLIRSEADGAGVCPFELSLAAAYGADVLVGDLNYVFHPGSRLKRLFGRDLFSRRPRPWGLLVDEAHNLYYRAVDFLSPVLERKAARVLAEGCYHGSDTLYREFLQILLKVDDLFEGLIDEVEKGPRAGARSAVVEPAPEPWTDLSIALEIWLPEYLAYVKTGGRRPLQFVPRRKDDSRRIVDPAIHFCMEFFAFVETAEERAEEMVAVLSGLENPDCAVLQINCLDPSRYLAGTIKDYFAAVAMSATMEPLDFYMDVLGMNRRVHAGCAFPSPFPPSNRLLVVDESVSTRYEDRGKYISQTAQTLVEMASARTGVHLAFFPSYEFMASAVTFLRMAAGMNNLGVEVIQVSNAAKAVEVLEEIRRITDNGNRRPDGCSKLVCTVMGGVMSEGVDYPGETAVGAYIVGPGLPAVTFERGLMLEYHDRRDGRGFEYAYLHPGLTRVVQAAGRVIRSENDRGVMVLMGKRFTEAAYRDLLPGYWKEEMLITGDPVAAVHEFWNRFDD